MAHHTLKSSYRRLEERLNRFPQGAPPSDLLYRILQMLFTEREAGLVALLPIKPFSARQAARAWEMPLAQAERVLEGLASKALLLDTVEPEGSRTYVLPPPMAGFIEFSLMRVREDLDQKTLSELLYQYITVEEEFITALFTLGETQLGRVFVSEAALPPDDGLQVLDYERASEVARSASCIGVGLCYCRHKMAHLERACDAPMDICMTFNGTAESLVRHGHARKADTAECLDLLQRARDLKLVQFGENVRERVNFICNCCGCCCEALLAAKRFGHLHPVHTTNYLPDVDAARCSGCGSCVASCPVEAMELVSAGGRGQPKRMRARLDGESCLGCGVCVTACARGALKLEPRGERVITPLNSTHKAVLMAIERGCLQELIFDNQALRSHRAMAAVLGVILKLPPVRQALASRQMRSRYLEALIRRVRS